MIISQQVMFDLDPDPDPNPKPELYPELDPEPDPNPKPEPDPEPDLNQRNLEPGSVSGSISEKFRTRIWIWIRKMIRIHNTALQILLIN